MKTKTKILIILCTIAIMAFSFKKCSCEEKELASKLTKVSKENEILINPPLPNINIPYQYFDIDSRKDTIITTESGTEIRIPKNAFLDEAGNTITENVKLQYREFRNPLDFYVAGIPMGITDNGEDKVLLSGGMFEINATNAKNTSVFVNPSNKIKVDLLSDSKSTEFNVYDLDEETKQWIVKGKDQINVSSKEAEIDALNIPPLPEIAKPYSFSIKDETGNFPEISEYENVMFTPINVAECKGSDSQEMKVIPRKNGIYEVVFISKIGKFKSEKSCLCHLAFEEGKEYSKALETYKKKYAKLIDKKNELLKRWAKYELYLEKNKILNVDLNEKITRTLEVNKFGIVNCDRPFLYPVGVELAANFVDEEGNQLKLNNVALIEKGINVLYRYTNVVKFNPNKENILFGITADNKLAYVKKVELAKITNSSKNIPMTVFKGQLNKYEDIYEFVFKN